MILNTQFLANNFEEFIAILIHDEEFEQRL